MGWTEQNWDHERDTRKHEPRPGERDYVPLSAEPKPITTALEIALLVKTIDLTTGAGLIEQYAQTIAAGARLDQTQITADRILASIEAPLSRVTP